jgi:membrane-associated phospholipid phosphatase
MFALCPVITTILALSTTAAAGAAEPAELQLRPWVDGPVLVSTLTYTLVTFLDDETPWVMQAEFPEPGLAMDQRWVGLAEIDDEGPAQLSDLVGLYPSFGMPVVMGALGALRPADSPGARAGQAGTWFVVGAQAVTVNATTTHIVKHAVRRPRPYAYGDAWRSEHAEALAAGEPVECEAQLSFYSGHTSAAGAWSFGLAHSLAITHDWPWYGELLPYLAATGVTAWTGVLRVQAHKHFPSDVLVGGLAGATVGILVPELHRGERVTLATGSTADGTPTMGLSAAW